MKLLFQYTDNPERGLKLRNVELLRQWTQRFFENCRVDNRNLCVKIETRTDCRSGIYFLKNVKIYYYFIPTKVKSKGKLHGIFEHENNNGLSLTIY